MTPVRLALVGFGAWGRNYVRAAHDSGVAEVTQVVLRDDSPSIDAAAAAGLRAVSLIRDITADAAVVATHPRIAPWIASALLHSGFPVMIEKPAALSAAAAEEIAKAERDSKRTVLVAHQHLFADGYEEMVARGVPDRAEAAFTGPVKRDYPALLDYGSHGVACLLGLGCERRTLRAGADEARRAEVTAWFGGEAMHYNGYEPQEPPLTRAVRSFANAVRNGGADDWRFGAKWAVNVARVLEAPSKSD